METLRSFMTQFEPGPIDDTSPLEPMLASTWDQFTGDDEGMTGAKIGIGWKTLDGNHRL